MSSVAILDSGAGALAIAKILTKARLKPIVYCDRENFPYGVKSPDEIRDTVQSRIDCLKNSTTPPDVILVGCNTASLCLEPQEGVVLLPKPDPASYDYFLGSTLSAKRVEKSIDTQDFIVAIQGWSEGKVDASELGRHLFRLLRSVESGSRIYLGCTHFSLVADDMKYTAQGYTFIEPDYIALVRDSIQTQTV